MILSCMLKNSSLVSQSGKECQQMRSLMPTMPYFQGLELILTMIVAMRASCSRLEVCVEMVRCMRSLKQYFFGWALSYNLKKKTTIHSKKTTQSGIRDKIPIRLHISIPLQKSWARSADVLGAIQMALSGTLHSDTKSNKGQIPLSQHLTPPTLPAPSTRALTYQNRLYNRSAKPTLISSTTKEYWTRIEAMISEPG